MLQLSLLTFGTSMILKWSGLMANGNIRGSVVELVGGTRDIELLAVVSLNSLESGESEMDTGMNSGAMDGSTDTEVALKWSMEIGSLVIIGGISDMLYNKKSVGI